LHVHGLDNSRRGTTVSAALVAVLKRAQYAAAAEDGKDVQEERGGRVVWIPLVCQGLQA